MTPTPPWSIRSAGPDDVDEIANLIRELAVYEKLEQFARATADDLRRDLFGPRPYAEVLIAEVDGAPAGFALYFHNYSTFRGRPGIYLEDLFVKPEYRGLGIGKGLLTLLAKIAVARGCAKLEWVVLDWNEPSIGFYRSLGAVPQDEWTVYRLDGESLARAATLAPEGTQALTG